MRVGSHKFPLEPAATVETDRLIVVLYQAASFVLGLVLYFYLLLLLLKIMLHPVVFYLFAMHAGVVDDDVCELLPMQFWFRLGSSS